MAFRKCVVGLLTFFCLASWAQNDASETAGGQAIVLTVEGAIGPATTHYLTKGLDQALDQGAELVIIRMDTPGGLDAATRDIVQAILASPVPVAFYVSPSGARAASAGTYILYSAHIAAMAPSTSLGAATPVQIGGGDMGGGDSSPADPEPDSEDSAGESTETEEEAGASAMERKVINDAVAFIRGLAELRGRNAEWAEAAVRDAVSLTATSALENNVIDLIAEDLNDLLEQIDGRTVQTQGGQIELDTANLTLEFVEPDWRSQLLSIITDPSVAYFLMLAGIYGLIFEGYNPGALVPGIVGAICIITALYAFQILPVNYAGFALIGLGLILMIAEATAPSFGVLGIGGVIALTVGSIFLMDTDVPGLQISRSLIAAVAIISGTLFMLVLAMAGRTLRMARTPSREVLVGAEAVALDDFIGEGQVRLHGEIWCAISDMQVKADHPVIVEQQEGLTLRVHPADIPTEHSEE